jgi:hypothetical protein
MKRHVLASLSAIAIVGTSFASPAISADGRCDRIVTYSDAASGTDPGEVVCAAVEGGAVTREAAPASGEGAKCWPPEARCSPNRHRAGGSHPALRHRPATLPSSLMRTR